MRQQSLKITVIGALLLCVLLFLPIEAEASGIETVRVGFFRLDGYHEINEDGKKDGYGYALMQSIRRYTDLDFEYVGYDRTWTEMLEMLENGEIDVLSYAAITPERQEKFLYSTLPVGTCDLILSVKAGNASVQQGNYETYEGKRIGFVRGIAENALFERFAEENGFNYEAVYFSRVAELSTALQSEEVDCIVYTDFRSGKNEWVIERLTASDIYLIVRKEDGELMRELNAALEHLTTRETGWRAVLKNTYYPYDNASTICFTLREREALERYAAGRDVLRITAMPDNAPYSWFDTDENGNVLARGVWNTLFMALMQEMGVQYEFVAPADYNDYLRLVQSGEVDIVADMARERSVAEQWGYIITPDYDGVALAKVYNRRLEGEPGTVGCLESSPYLLERVRTLAGNAGVVTFASTQEAIDALYNRELDVFYCLEHTAKILVNQDERGQLRHAVLSGEEYSFCVAVRDDLDRGIVSALSAVIEHSGAGVLQGIYDNNINFGVDRTPGLVEAFYNDPVPVVAVGSVISLVIVFLIFIVLHIRRRERERSLRAEIESNALLSTMYSAMPFAFLRLEVTDGVFRVIYANPRFLEIFGAETLEEASERYADGLGRGILDREHSDVCAMYDDLRQLGDRTVAESRLKISDGSIRWMRWTNTLVDIVGKTRVVQQMILDITDEKQAQEQREREHTENAINQMFAILTRRTSDVYVLYSMHEHQAKFVSPNTEQLLGIPTENACVDIRAFLETELEGGGIPTKEQLQAIELGENLLGEVKRVHLRTGEVRWYQDEAYIFRIRGERHLIIVMSDRTEERKNREALQMALCNAENASKAKTTFLSNMSHDIRTPMNTILGLTNLLKSDIEDREKSAAHLDNLEITANNMMEIINNVLDMSRIESGTDTLNESLFCLPDVLKEIGVITETQARVKNLKIRTAVEVDEENYIGDTLRLKQILLNLVSNAVKYTPRGGTIDLRVKTLKHMAAQRSVVRFTIRDTGVGMSKEFQRELFSPFARERNTTVSGILGTGLGMSIVKNLVDLMGGTIRVESSEGEGSTFTVDIPLRRAESLEKPEERSGAPVSMDISGVKLLVAEDNELNAEILIELLRREGAQCDRAENGRIAVEKFCTAPEDAYDMILMDIQMPEMDGYEAARAIRVSSHPQAGTIPISAMTANAFAEDVEAALDAGMDAHIAKPVDMAQLKATIRRLVDGEK